jgi:hypothetical protein
MIEIVKKTKNKIFYISPKEIKYCIYPSKYCDYTHAGLSKSRPHAGKNRGVFSENLLGYTKIDNSKWDYKKGVLFTKIFEYEALLNHYKGKENWKKSKFAQRCAKFIKLKNTIRGFSDYKLFLVEREKQIDKLFNSILKKGIEPNNIPREKNTFVDNISVVLTEKSKLYFNNRGHHRLSIAKILGLKKIPIKITVSKSVEILNNFYLKYK